MSQDSVNPKPSEQLGLERPSDTRRAIAVCLFLIVSVLLVFGHTLTFAFVNADDNAYVYNEPHVSAGLSWSGIVWAFTAGPLGEWYPLSMFSHMLDCQLYGLNPAGHHLTNVLLHAASAVALFLVLWRMTAALWSSALVAALFALHPLHVESVAWISERRDVLSGLFFMLTLGAYDSYVRQPRSLGRYLAVAGFLALGLMAKPILVTVPPLLLLLDFWPLQRFGQTARAPGGSPPQPATFPWRVVLDKLPLLALAIAAVVMTLHTHGAPANPLSVPQRLANAAISCVAYLGQLFVPIGLSIFTAHPEAGRPTWQVAAAVALLIVITAAAVVGRRSHPYFFVGWFWYLGMLAPVLGLTYVGGHARADRYTYLSQIGLYIALVWAAARLGASWPARRWVVGVGSALMLAVLMASSWRQVGYWRDSKTVWQRALACDPKNVTAHCFLAAALQDTDEQAAIAHFRQAIQLDPHDRIIYRWPRAQAHVALGDIARRNGETADAIAHYLQALEFDPTFVPAHMNAGELLANGGRLDQAIAHFRRSIELSSDGAPAAHCNLATALSVQGKNDEAIANFRQALAADRSLAVARINLAILLAERNEVDAAILELRQGIDVDPNAPVFYFQLAQSLRKQNQLSEADQVDEQGKLAARRQAESLVLRGDELARQGKHAEAIAQYRQALAIDPNFAPATHGLQRLSNR